MIETPPGLLTFYGVVRNVLEFLGALSIVAGAVLTLVRLLRPMLTGGRVNVRESRFQLSSDVLGTAIAPTWTAIGKLAAIGTIRTALNYVLTREMKGERPQLDAPDPDSAIAADHPEVTSSGE